MKKIVAIFMLILTCISCSGDDTKPPTTYYGKWQLIEISGSSVNSLTIGSEMIWQESYNFETNGKFIKIRIQDDITTTESGTFLISKISNETHFELTYSKSSALIGNCDGNLKEYLFINSNNLLSNTWQNCDGPVLVYQKKD